MATTTGLNYLGRVKRAPHRGDAYYYASIEPLLESDPIGAEWLGPVRDTMSCFPKRGLVHWHDAPLTLEVGSLWQFTIDEHPFAARGDRSSSTSCKVRWNRSRCSTSAGGPTRPCCAAPSPQTEFRFRHRP